MAIDFPATPTLNQVFTQGGQSWTWDGTKWNSLTGGFSDAPSDGFTYGRKNAAWSSVDALLAPAVQAGAYNVGRNVVHNPLFNVAQRGAGPWTSAGFTADRWFLAFALDTTSVSIVTVADAGRVQIGDEAARNVLNLSVTGNAGAGSYSEIIHKVESVARLAGKTVTLSFWAVAGSGTPKIGLIGAQVFGNGGSPSGPVVFPMQIVTISTAWARYSVTFAIPSMAGKTLGTNGDDCTQWQIVFSSGTTNFPLVGVQSNTFQLWGIQLEIGTTATPLEKPDPQQDLAKCQRFYQIGFAQLFFYQPVGGANGSTMISWPVTMRATPTITPTVTNNQNGQSIAMNAQAANGSLLYGASAAAGQVNVAVSYTASADL